MSWQAESIPMAILLLRVGPQQQLGQEITSAIWQSGSRRPSWAGMRADI